MRLVPGDKKYQICLIHENNQTLRSIKDKIIQNVNNVNIDENEFLDNTICNNEFEQIDLLILNLHFDEESLNKLYNYLKIIYHDEITTTFLFITDPKEFDSDKISFLKEFPYLVYDFVDPSFLDSIIFINRIKVLLDLKRLEKLSNYKSKNLELNLWNLLDYSNIYALILDKNLKIMAISNHLAKTIGVNRETLIGCNWTMFLKFGQEDVLKHIVSNIIKQNGNYTEFTNDIVDINQNIITVKWFNALINHNYNWVFSVGVSLDNQQPTINEDIQSIRSYFKEILEKDKTTINAMREVAKEYSSKFLKDSEKNNKTKIEETI
jgi:hypothetical protein